MKWLAAQEVYGEHLKLFKKPEDLKAVTDYHDAQDLWLRQTMQPEADKDEQTKALKEKLEAKETALKALPTEPKADAKIIDAEVSAKRNYMKYKVDNIDKVDPLNKKCQDAGECSNQDYEKLTEAYIIADGQYTLAKNSQDEFEKVVKSATETIDAHTFATITTCDATEGIVHKTYDAASCEGKPETEFKAQWGACVQAPDAKSFIKVTGAAALQAAAVAVVAFAGSQF